MPVILASRIAFDQGAVAVRGEQGAHLVPHQRHCRPRSEICPYSPHTHMKRARPRRLRNQSAEGGPAGPIRARDLTVTATPTPPRADKGAPVGGGGRGGGLARPCGAWRAGPPAARPQAPGGLKGNLNGQREWGVFDLAMAVARTCRFQKADKEHNRQSCVEAMGTDSLTGWMRGVNRLRLM